MRIKRYRPRAYRIHGRRSAVPRWLSLLAVPIVLLAGAVVAASILFEDRLEPHAEPEVLASVQPQITAIALPAPAASVPTISERSASSSRAPSAAPPISAPAVSVEPRPKSITKKEPTTVPPDAKDIESTALASRALKAAKRDTEAASSASRSLKTQSAQTLKSDASAREQSQVSKTRIHLTRIESGESLFDVVSRYRLRVADLMTALEANSTLRKKLRGIRPGQRVFLEAPRDDDSILRFAVDMRGETTLVVYRHNSLSRDKSPSYKMRSMPDRSIWKSERTLALTEEARRQHPPLPVPTDSRPVSAQERTSSSPTTEQPRPQQSRSQTDSDQTGSEDKISTQNEQLASKSTGTASALSSSLPDVRSSQYKEYLERKKELSCERLLGNKSHKRSSETGSCKQQTLKVRPGDSLYNLFKENGIDTKSLIQMASVRHGEHLQRLRPGQTLDLHVDHKGIVHRLSIPLSLEEQLLFNRRDTTYTSELAETPLTRRQVSAAGVIESSLFASGQQAGLPDKLVMQLVNIFAWDIDFSEDVRPGDSFKVVYEELLQEGEVISVGRILAAEFGNRGKRKRAIRFEDKSGTAAYYTPDGFGMRKAFLRNPVEFSRISSRFNLRRRHPILHKIRAHKGVDYAAATGTPVRAAGAGVVESAGRQRGYGKTVVLKHGKKYTTLYAHLSKYGKGIKRGSKVKQGQVIGHVGSTGLATGPHLHYEFRIDGKHRDPLSVRLPKSLPLEKRHRRAFNRIAGPLVAELDSIDRTKMASR